MGLLQEIRKKVSLKYTVKQEPYSAPVQETHNAQMQQNISHLQADIQFLIEAMTTPHNQYAALCAPLLSVSKNSFLN